jgi:hypothetical protein
VRDRVGDELVELLPRVYIVVHDYFKHLLPP